MIKWVDQNGQPRVFDYDLADQLTGTTDSLGRITNTAYDMQGRIDLSTDASGRSFNPEYDYGGRVTSVSFKDGSSQNYTYDNLNRVTSISDLPEGTTISYKYDEAGNIVEVTEADGDVIGYDWDLAGNRTRVSYPDGTWVGYEYDELNRLVSANHNQHGQTQYSYDDDSRLTDVEFPDGGARRYHYTGELLTGFSDAGKSWHMSYDASGRIKRISGAEHWRFEYDDGGQLQNARRDDRRWHYDYDAVGNLVSLSDNNGGSASYHHDIANQLSSSVESSATGSFKHDSAGRLIEEKSPNGDRVSYDYDTRGRLSELTTIRPPVSTLNRRILHIFSIDTHRFMDADRNRDINLSGIPKLDDQWFFKRLSTGYFLLRNEKYDKYLAVRNESTSHSDDDKEKHKCEQRSQESVCLRLTTKTNVASQWKITQRDNGTFALASRLTGQYLKTKHSNKRLVVGLGGDSEDTAAHWKIFDVKLDVPPKQIDLLQAQSESWSRTYGPDGLLATVTNAKPSGTSTTWSLTWDRTLSIPKPLGWEGPEDIALIHGVGPALTIKNGHASAIQLSPLGDVIGSPVAVNHKYSPYGDTTANSFGLGYRGELHTGPTINPSVL